MSQATSGCGTELTSRGDRAMSAFGGIADNKCSGRAFPLMTLNRHRPGSDLFLKTHTRPVKAC